MNDFNFFRIYLPKENKNEFKNVVIILSIALSIFIFGSFIYYKIKAGFIEKNINFINSKMSETTFKDGANKYNILKNKNDILKDYALETKEIKGKTGSARVLTTKLIDQINEAKPNEIKIMYFDLAKDILTIKGKSDDRVKVAMFEGNLNENKQFENVHVLNILNNVDGDDKSFDFEIKCSLKDVDNYEIK